MTSNNLSITPETSQTEEAKAPAKVLRTGGILGPEPWDIL